MSNLHRHLAPISDEAWAQIEQEASRTLKRHLAARRVVDVTGPKGPGLAAVGTGHTRQIECARRRNPGRSAGGKGIGRAARPLSAVAAADRRCRSRLERFGLVSREGSGAQDRLRRRSRGVRGLCGSLPANVRAYPDVVAQAVSQLRLAGCNGPYALVLGASTYTAASGGADDGYPIFHHIERIVDGGTIWAPAIEGAFVLTTRGGDFELDIGQDFSIGYLSHSSSTVELYFQESFTFRVLTTEASVVLTPAKAPAAKSK